MKKFMLEFKVTTEGLYICGNQQGLRKFGEMLTNAAKEENFFHQHLSFSLHMRLKK